MMKFLNMLSQIKIMLEKGYFLQRIPKKQKSKELTKNTTGLYDC